MTKNRKMTQIILVSLGLFLIIATYFLYPKIIEKKYEDASLGDNKSFSEKKESNLFEDVEYGGFYGPNNPFTVEAEKAYISDDNPEIVYMENMYVTLHAREGRIIIITSDEGSYNKTTYDCFFKKNVKATDGETVILSENLDLLSSDESATAYNDVILTNENGSLQADKVDYNFETKYYKISMYDNKKVKVKLIQ